MPFDALAERRSRQSTEVKAPRAKNAAQRIHEVKRAVPLISASAPRATTLARQPCRNLARMLAIRLKNLAYSLFFPAIIAPVFPRSIGFSPRNRSRFPSRKLRIVAYPSSRGRDQSSKASRMPPQRHHAQSPKRRACRHSSIARIFTAELRMALRRHRARRRNSIAYAAITAP